MKQMPNGRYKYNQAQRETLEFKTLYGRYKAPKSSKYRDIFPTFQAFYDWSMENGFMYGAKLEIKDYSKPLTPDNCRWVMPAIKTTKITVEDKNDFVDRWNKTVNRIRVHYGLEPFENKENECNENLL